MLFHIIVNKYKGCCINKKQPRGEPQDIHAPARGNPQGCLQISVSALEVSRQGQAGAGIEINGTTAPQGR